MTRLEDYPSVNRAPGVILFILFWVGLGLMFANVNLYADVAMPRYIVFLLLIVPGVIFTPLLFKVVPSQKLKGVSKGLVLFVANIVAFGSIFLYGVLAIDYYNAPAAPVTTARFLITTTGYTTFRFGNGQIPFAEISYRNRVKRFDFPDETLTTIVQYKNLQLETTPGFLGFDVIKGKQLVK